MTATLFLDSEGWGVVLGAWNDPDQTWLPGFDSHFDAYAFCVATTGIDPLATIPDDRKRSTKLPQPDTSDIETAPTVAPYAQFRLFSEVTQ